MCAINLQLVLPSYKGLIPAVLAVDEAAVVLVGLLENWETDDTGVKSLSCVTVALCFTLCCLLWCLWCRWSNNLALAGWVAGSVHPSPFTVCVKLMLELEFCFCLHLLRRGGGGGGGYMEYIGGAPYKYTQQLLASCLCRSILGLRSLRRYGC